MPGVTRARVRRWVVGAWIFASAGPAGADGVEVSAGAGGAGGLDVEVSQNAPHLMPYQVLELTFRHEGRYADPTWDVEIEVALTSPGGRRVVVGDFFYGSSRPQAPVVREVRDGSGRTRKDVRWPCDPAELWKARYAPSELGRWRYEWTFRAPGGRAARGTGELRVVRGRVSSPGWVRIHPRLPHRFVFEDGSAFFPVGIQNGVFDQEPNGSAMDTFNMEGPFRLGPEGRRPTPPPGALFARGPSSNPRNGDIYLRRHALAGFNLWRFSPHNFSLPVFDIAYSDDGDGVPDRRDAFPLEREEQKDVDGDRIGDRVDVDLDGDGISDDRDGDGVPDAEETDSDGDGVPDAAAVPWDAFPYDPREWRDTDGDGTGDRADPDDDGDGWSDAEEERAGTDPRSAVSFPLPDPARPDAPPSRPGA